MGAHDDVGEGRLERPDGRVVAWTEFGEPGWQPVLRFPGTPGSRWSIRADRGPWIDRRLRMITTERPGFGRSTRLPGRGFSEHADDVAAILDHLNIETAHVIGGSGGAPHLLAFCARHGDRVNAATILVGIAPLNDDEIDDMIPHNAEAFRASAAGDAAGLERVLAPAHEAMLQDPIAALKEIMNSAPEDDQEILADPTYQASLGRAILESQAQGIDGWVDEGLALANFGADIDVEAIEVPIVWYHAAGDRNCPLSAAKRLVDRIPSARLVEWGAEVGHLHAYRREPEILDALMAR